MSAAFIIALIVGGILALLLVVFVANHLERCKLERARRKSELVDRQERLAVLSEGIPGQYLTADLKQALHGLELKFLQELLQEDANNKKLQERSEELRKRIAQAGDYVPANSPIQIHAEEQVKEIRLQLESLHAQLRRALNEGLLPADNGRKWLSYLQEQLINLYLDFFQLSGQNQLQRGLPRQARLIFERAVLLIKRQKNMLPHKERLQVFQNLLEKTNSIVMEHDQSAVEQASELSEAMNGLETEENWKKKQLYD